MKLTVFTPTYNRAALLPRVYKSLCSQAADEIEWLIVDDGSCDDTSQVVHSLLEEKKIAIRYVKQKNGGKHTAFNTAAELARGEYFLCLDSDDWLADHAAEKILTGLTAVGDGDCGLIAYKQLPDGKQASDALPKTHQGLYAYSSRYGVRGEFTLIFKTNLVKKYLYPVTPGEKFVGECVLYDRMELDGYRFCPLPEVVEVCEYQQDGLTSNLYQIMLNNPMGYQIYHAQRIDLVNTTKERFQHAVRYHAFRLMSEKNTVCIKANIGCLLWVRSFRGGLQKRIIAPREKSSVFM